MYIIINKYSNKIVYKIIYKIKSDKYNYLNIKGKLEN